MPLIHIYIYIHTPACTRTTWRRRANLSHAQHGNVVQIRRDPTICMSVWVGVCLPACLSACLHTTHPTDRRTDRPERRLARCRHISLTHLLTVHSPSSLLSRTLSATIFATSDSPLPGGVHPE